MTNTSDVVQVNLGVLLESHASKRIRLGDDLTIKNVRVIKKPRKWYTWIFGCFTDQTETKIYLQYSEFVHSITMEPVGDSVVPWRHITVKVFQPVRVPGCITISSRYDIAYSKTLVVPDNVDTLIFTFIPVNFPPPHAICYDNDQSWYEKKKHLPLDLDNCGPL
jgi:hypothetical protein